MNRLLVKQRTHNVQLNKAVAAASGNLASLRRPSSSPGIANEKKMTMEQFATSRILMEQQAGLCLSPVLMIHLFFSFSCFLLSSLLSGVLFVICFAGFRRPSSSFDDTFLNPDFSSSPSELSSSSAAAGEEGKRVQQQQRLRRQYVRELKTVLELADVVCEVLDARDPLGCRCTELEQKVMASMAPHAGQSKKLVLILNKIG